MRPIEFRIYCEQNMEMLKVDYLHFDDKGELWSATSVDDVVPYLENQKDWHLMQYTGLKDKNGSKIFEGDIGWDEHNECWGVVVFDEGKFLYEWENISEDLWEVKGDIEIRGNSHDNPELIGGEAE
ncbi:YopX family protein [Listeria booriae]|uniref:YopX family protein n=1 Tax=Listeria booriae TaxID=1552123 RepID=UPI001624FDD9|nr:YopX family protein [Listeria booriae]MBC1801019.1 DNA-packaging protein [Listeria booriae]